ncbi:hypothetical protein GGI17_006285 [Coemansia sp. S146]|nr:hypothetical protein GGI17_006285 [Coemansia sp. S146]
MDTLVERRMRQMSSDIRSKSDWIGMINDADTRTSWAAEAKAEELTDVEFEYVLDELAYYASLHPPDSNVRLSAADGVRFSDALIDAETTKKLKSYSAILKNLPDCQKDCYPNNHFHPFPCYIIRFDYVFRIPNKNPLLWVSHNFRAVAYSHLCDNFELDFYNNFEPNLYNKALGYILKHRMPAHCRDMDYRTFNYLGYSTHHLAKDITIILDERTVYSGEALEMVSRAPYDGCSFPLARKITFTFVLEKTDRVDKNNWNDPLIAEANIGAFVERIKQMAPLAGTIIVRPASRDDIPSISNQHFGYLASRLYQLAYRIECIYNPSNVDPIRLQLDMVCNLTYVSYTSWSDVDSTYQFSQLARINARTLQSLGFHCRHYIDILRLVQDTGGNDVTYPRLLALKLCSVSNSNALKRPVFHGAAPFPILRRLRINLECPFDDATFFRGNAATLEWLNMRLDSLNASMLRKYKMFVPGSHPKLQSVKLGYTDDFGSDLLASPAETIQFMYNIGSGAAVREHVQMGHPRNYLLPPHVVKLIVDHVAASSRLRFDGITTDSEEYRLLQVPLLWVCHNFRAFVHQRFCRVYELTLEDDQDRAETRHYSWPTRCKELDYPTHHLAKELQVKLDIKSVYSGKALQLLSDTPYEGRSFPLVRKLSFELTSDSDGNYYWEPVCDDLRDDDDDDDTPKTHYVCPPNTVANIIAFVQRIKKMAPAVSEIDVTHVGDAERLLQRCNVHVSDLVQQLFDIVERRTVISRDNYSMVMCLDLEPIRDLVHLECSLDTDSKDLLPLIRRSTQTLQFLGLDVGDVETTGAVRDPDSGDYLEYPCLHTLIIRLFRNPWPSQEAFSKDIVLFPRLLRLTVSYRYPFGDDLPFRGNSGTLEYLELRLLPETVSILKKYRVFTPTSHPNLKCVKLNMPLRRVPDIFATATEYMQFVLSIGPGASVREITESTEYPEEHTLALSMLKDHGCIQILSFPYTIMSLWEAISLVKSLPLLSDLTTKAPVLGELPQGVGLPELPSSICATYAPMGKRFRCWHICTYWNEKVDYIKLATCILSLALACPNFDYAAVDGDHRETFMKGMQEKIDEPEFSQDAPRLRRLLFHGWEDC